MFGVSPLLAVRCVSCGRVGATWVGRLGGSEDDFVDLAADPERKWTTGLPLLPGTSTPAIFIGPRVPWGGGGSGREWWLRQKCPERRRLIALPRLPRCAAAPPRGVLGSASRLSSAYESQEGGGPDASRTSQGRRRCHRSLRTPRHGSSSRPANNSSPAWRPALPQSTAEWLSWPRGWQRDLGGEGQRGGSRVRNREAGCSLRYRGGGASGQMWGRAMPPPDRSRSTASSRIVCPYRVTTSELVGPRDECPPRAARYLANSRVHGESKPGSVYRTPF